MACLPPLVSPPPPPSPSVDPAAFASFDPTSHSLSLSRSLSLRIALFRRCEIQCQRRRKRGTPTCRGTERNETVPHSVARTFPVYPSYDRTASVAVCQWRCQPRCNEWERGEPVIPPKVAFENRPASLRWSKIPSS